MKRIKYETLTDAELAAIAKHKNVRGIATSEALEAARELHDRHHWDEVDYRNEIEGENKDAD